MSVDTSERDFQAQIEHVLRNRHGYHKRFSSQEGRTKAITMRIFV